MELKYGSVLIMKGEHKGKLGYYDDDNDSGKKAIVYLGEPFQSEYILIKHEYLQNLSSVPHELFKKENKELCEKLGIE